MTRTGVVALEPNFALGFIVRLQTRLLAGFGRAFSPLGGGEDPARPGVSVDPARDDDAVVVVRDDLVGVDKHVGDGGRVLV